MLEIKSTTSILAMLTILFVSAFNNIRAWERYSDSKVHLQEENLGTPFFTLRAFPIFEKEIILGYSNPNADSKTEIYISRSADTAFNVAEIASPGEEVYEDTSRVPRTTYYFKLRAVKGNLKSGFSATKSFTTGSKFYPPVLTAEATGPATVELKLRDRTYNDLHYIVWREAPGPNATFRIVAADSGHVYTIKDSLLEPNTQYHYRVDAYTRGPNMPRYINITNAAAVTNREPGPGVANFSVVDARTGKTITDFNESISLDAGDPDFHHWTIRANSDLDDVGSVLFKIDVQKKNVENEAPYLLHGYHFRALTPTPHILETETYSKRLARGVRLQSRAVLLRFVNNTAVSSFVLLDANGEEVQELNDGNVVDVNDPRLKTFNIQALLNRQVHRGSVQFFVNEKLFWTENREPYIMVTGSRRWWDGPGKYTVMAVPYSKRNGQGARGTPRTVRLTISEIPTDRVPLASKVEKDTLQTKMKQRESVSIYPVPAQDVLYILVDEWFSEQDWMVVIRDLQGEIYFKKLMRFTSHSHMLELKELGLKTGMYNLELSTRTVTERITFIKE
ncbi:MAG TPA: hypothetical protein VIQ51_02785 [Chryseosolibacter sp.]